MKKQGKQTIIFKKPPVITGYYSVVGNKEGEGPLKEYFDMIVEDNKFGEKTLKMLLQLKRADNRGQNIRDFDRTAEYDRLEAVIDGVLEKQQCFSLNHLAVNGTDLINMGIPPSKTTGRILNTLLDMVINGETANDKTQLLLRAEILKKEL